MTLLNVRDPALPGHPADSERLGVGLVAKNVKDAGRRGDGPPVQCLLNPVAKLFLRKELLEGAPPGQNAVALEIDRGVSSLPVEARGDNEHLPGEFPRGRQDDDALRGIFDHVDDVAQIYDVRRRPLLVRKEGRIPTGDRHPHLVQPQQVVATTAAVVEERPLPVDEPVVKRKRDGAG